MQILCLVIVLLRTAAEVSATTTTATTTTTTMEGPVVLSVNRSAYGDSVSLCQSELKRCAMGATVFVESGNITCVDDTDVQRRFSAESRACFNELVPMVEGVFTTNNSAAMIKSGRLHVFYDHSYYVGQLFQVGTRVAPGDCSVVGLEVVREGRLLKLQHSGLSFDRENGTIKVNMEKFTSDLRQRNFSSESLSHVYRMSILCGQGSHCFYYFKLTGTSLSHSILNVSETAANACRGSSSNWVLYVGVVVLGLFVVAWVVIIAATLLARRDAWWRGRRRKEESVLNISKPLTVSNQQRQQSEAVKSVSMSVRNPNYENSVTVSVEK